MMPEPSFMCRHLSGRKEEITIMLSGQERSYRGLCQDNNTEQRRETERNRELFPQTV
jgi:hypothetical protein